LYVSTFGGCYRGIPEDKAGLVAGILLSQDLGQTKETGFFTECGAVVRTAATGLLKRVAKVAAVYWARCGK
jgi:hypothetical protein